MPGERRVASGIRGHGGRVLEVELRAIAVTVAVSVRLLGRAVVLGLFTVLVQALLWE